MGYVGNQTTTSYSSMDKQVITGDGGTGYTLSHAVANAQEIEVFVNNVRQEPAVAYTATGTTLTMTGNVESTDDFYVVYQGKAVQTVVPPDGSVTSAKLDTNMAVAGTLTTSQVNVDTVGVIGIADGDNLYIASDDTSDVGLKFNGDGNRIQPCDASGASRDNAIDLGETGSSRFKDLYLGGVVQIEGSTRSFKIEQENYGLRIADVSGGNTERLRIDAGGVLLINTSSSLGNGGTSRQQVYGGTGVCAAFQNTNAGAQTMGIWNSGDSGTRYFVWFESSSGRTHVGSITSNGSSTSYNTSSDYRLKTNVSYDWDATSRLKQLKPARFDWISEGDDAVTVDGFLAHEAQAVVPEAVTGTKDEVDDDGNPVMQGIDQSKIVPLLVKTIQELEARITALEAN